MADNYIPKQAVGESDVYTKIVLADGGKILAASGSEIINVSAAGVPTVVADIQAPAGSIGLAELATLIQPSHVVKFFKLGSTITGVTLTGLAVNDLIVSVIVDGTVTVGTCAVANTLPTDPADTTYVIVFRATA